MSFEVACTPITSEETVAGGWGKASVVAIARIENRVIVDWRTEKVGWDALHDAGSEGGHHARIARFLIDNRVTLVAAAHMGEAMQRTLNKLGIRVVLGASGDARAAVRATTTA